MRMRPQGYRCALLVAATACGVAGSSAWGQPSDIRSVAAAAIVEKAPVIDGNLNDAAWGEAGEPLVLLNAIGTRPATPAARFRVCTDREWLYFAIEADDRNTARFDRTNHGRDRIEWEETIEVMIAPDPQQSRYYHFAVAPGGSDHDAIEQAPGTDMDFSWRHQQKVTAKGWVAEIAIPLKELGRVEGVVVGDRLAINVCRATRGAGADHDNRQTWSATGGSFHSRQAMGELVVGSFADASTTSLAGVHEQVDAVAAWVKDRGDPALVKSVAGIAEKVAALREEAPRVTSADRWVVLDARVRQLSSELRAVLSGNDPLVTWRVNPWDAPPSDVVPGPDDARTDHLVVEGMQGEYLTAALGVANLSDAPIRFRVLPSAWESVGVAGRAAAADHLTVRRVTEVAVSGGAIIRDALPELGVEDEVTLLPGSNTVIWLTVRTHEMEPGAWRANLVLAPLLDPSKRKAVSLEARVLPITAPKGPRPYSANWANYEEDRPSSVHLEASFQDQREHGTSIHFLPGYAASGLGGLEYDERGEPVGEPSFSALDEWIDRFGESGQVYVLRINYSHLPKQMGGQDNLEDPQALRNFGWWVGKVRGHFESRGMGVRDFAWYAADEPDLEGVHMVQKFGKLMKGADPAQQLLVTVYQAQKLEWLEMMAPYVNLWVIKFNVSKEQRDFLLAQDARFFSYTVLANTSSPYMSYRREAMLAKAYGAESIGFWAYDDTAIPRELSSWLPRSGPSYAVIYEGQHSVVPSVRWEAWRQGIQDFRYVEWLEKLAEASTDPTLGSEARELAARTPQNILDSRDRTTADRLMADVRNAIARLLVADGTIAAEEVERVTREAPRCLTGNDPLDKGDAATATGRYTYSTATGGDPSHERLTDGSVEYPSGWTLANGAPEQWSVTFDLNQKWRLSHIEFLADVNPFVPNVRQFAVYTSASGDAGDWTLIDEVQLQQVPGEPQLQAPAGQMRDDFFIGLDLGSTAARFVRLEMHTPGVARLGEVRIYGWEAE